MLRFKCVLNTGVAKRIAITHNNMTMRWAIWYYLYNLKNVKNTRGGVLKLQLY